MARYEKSFFGSIDDFVPYLDNEIMNASMTASFTDGSDVVAGEARVVVRVYERYAASSGSRVSLSVTCVGWGSQVYVSAITAGGSQGMFMKLMTWGEDSFLDVAASAIDSFSATNDLR